MKSARSEFPRSVKESLWLRADGHCEACGQAFAGRTPHYDHYPIPAALGGPGTIENGRCICVSCHRAITRAEDLPRISKAKKIERTRAGLRPKSSFAKQREWREKLRRQEQIELERDT